MKANFYNKLIKYLNTFNFKYVNYFASDKKIIIVAKKPHRYYIEEFIYINKPKTNKLQIIIKDE